MRFSDPSLFIKLLTFERPENIEIGIPVDSPIDLLICYFRELTNQRKHRQWNPYAVLPGNEEVSLFIKSDSATNHDQSPVSRPEQWVEMPEELTENLNGRCSVVL